ncbi:MAG: hypothetical protein AAFU53_07075, partial [Cyanobacteria bacterium J06632_3]
MALSVKRPACRITPRKLAKWLSGIVVGLLLANLWGYFVFAVGSPLATLVDVNGEENLATAFSVFLLLCCALSLWQISRWQISRHRLSYRFFTHWRVLSLLFVGMAFD